MDEQKQPLIYRPSSSPCLTLPHSKYKSVIMDIYIKTLTGKTIKMWVEPPDKTQEELKKYTQISWECKGCEQGFSTAFFEDVDIPTHCSDCAKKHGITDIKWTETQYSL